MYFSFSGHSSGQHRCPEGCPSFGHQRQRDDKGLPQAQDQGWPRLRHQGPDEGENCFEEPSFTSAMSI